MFRKIINKKIQQFQNDLIVKHTEEVENMYAQMRTWRHDYHNHIQTLKAHISLGNINEISQYLDDLELDLQTVDTVLKTGNIMVDAILNSKLSLILSKGINVSAKAVVPPNMKVADIDMCIVLGNLLDNAMEACLKCDDLGFIRVFVGVMKSQLYISVTNSTTSIKKIGNKYHSTKNKEGFGLLSIDKIAEKYGGFVNRKDEEDVFATEIFIPL